MIHIVIGPPCSGKSTYIETNANAGDLIVDFDKIAKALGAVESHNADGIIKEAAFSARYGAIDIALRNPKDDSWIIHTNPSQEEMDRYKDANADIIRLDPGMEECLLRAEHEGRPQRVIDSIYAWYGKEKSNMEHLVKNFGVKSDNDTGTISGYFSTYDRIPDSYGDVIAPGAFTDTIKAREESGHPFPLCWNHDLNQIIGKVDSIVDDEHGPLMTATFFDTPLAQEKRAIVQSGVVYQFSFAYDIEDQGEVTLEDGTKANELRKLNLFEVSIVPIPANPRAEVTEVKSGRRNSAKDADAIRQAIALLEGVLGEIDETVEEVTEDQTEVNEASEERKFDNEIKSALLEYIGGMNK